ncbi:MAG: hypothetical protein OQK24_14010 [Magnetovibrio sp.]|nr:hypothetical protein [Magnetovibrio sp.]
MYPNTSDYTAVNKPTYFLIDADDKIIETSNNWKKFAVANDGEHLTDVLDTKIWQHLCDPGMRLLYTALFQEIRFGPEHSISFVYHCDGPNTQRLYRMLVERQSAGQLLFTNFLLKSAPNTQALYQRYLSSHRRIKVCPHCMRLKIDGEWMNIIEALAGVEIMKDNYFFIFESSNCGQAQ